MNTPILVGICAVILLGSTEASAQQQGNSPDSSADNTTPRSIACAQERGAPLAQCGYRIKRGENGTTTVSVVFANGFKRGLFFMDGKFLKASVTMSGVGTDTDWSLEDGMYVIRVDGQHYEVPVDLIAGD